MVLVDEDEREEAVAAGGRTVLTKMPLERRSGGEEATRAGCEADDAAAAPTAPIESFLLVGPIGPGRELINFMIFLYKKILRTKYVLISTMALVDPTKSNI